MIWLAVVATFGASFLLVWQILNVLVGRLRWLPKGSVIVTGVPVSRLPEDPTGMPPDSPTGRPDLLLPTAAVEDWNSPEDRAIWDNET